MKKIPFLLLVGLLGFSAFATGAGEESDASAPAGTIATGDFEWEYMADTSPITIQFWQNTWGGCRPAVRWDDGLVSQFITQQTGVTLDMEVLEGEEDEVLAPMIASGDLPEMLAFGNYTSPLLQQIIDAGMVHAVSDLIDEYAPKTWDLVPPAYHAYHTAGDGKMWYWAGFMYYAEVMEAFEQINVPFTSGEGIMFTRRDILEAYGKDDITTLSEYDEYLRFAHANYPDVLSIDFGGSVSDLLFGRAGNNMFRGTFGMHVSGYYPQGDEVQLLFRDPKYLEFLQWLNGLYQDGLISKGQFTEQTQQSEERLYSAGYVSTVGAIFNVDNTVNTTIRQNDGNDDRTYTDIGPIVKQGVEFTKPTIRNKGYNGLVITKNAERPDRAVRFLQWALTEEGQTTLILGAEGETWDWVDGKKVMKQSAQDELNASFVDYASKYGVLCRWVPFCDTYYWTLYVDDYLGASPEHRATMEQRLKPFVVDAWDLGFAELASSWLPGSEVDIKHTQVEEAMAVAASRMVVADSADELMKIYNAALEEIDRLGARDVETSLTEEHGRQLAQLGRQ